MTSAPYVIRVAPHSPFDVTSNGQRFVFMKGRYVVLNWPDVAQRAPAGGK